MFSINYSLRYVQHYPKTQSVILFIIYHSHCLKYRQPIDIPITIEHNMSESNGFPQYLKRIVGIGAQWPHTGRNA